MIVYFNGLFLPQGQATIPITNRGFLFGDGIFTTLKVVKGQPQQLARHILRLSKQCKSLNIVFPGIEEQTVRDLIIKNQAFDGTWRLKIILTGSSPSDSVMNKRACDLVLMLLEPYETIHVKHLKLVSYPMLLAKPTAKIKSIAYLDSFLIKEFASLQGYDDAIIYSKEGYILETSCCNIFWILGNVFYTPALHLDLLPGIALDVIKEIVEKLGLTICDVETRHFPKGARLFVCNSLKGIQPVVQVDDKILECDERLTRELNEKFDVFESYSV